MSLQKRIVLIGGGGHCAVVSDILNRVEGYRVVAIVDRPKRIGATVAGMEIRYTDDDLPNLRRLGIEYALVCVGTTQSAQRRKRIFDCVKAAGFILPIVIDPDAVIMRGVALGEGTVIMPGAVVGTGATVGRNSIINTGAVVEHDCVIHDHVHVAPGAVLCGAVEVGENALVGTRSCVIQGIRIGDDTTVGAGAVVLTALPDSVVAYGNPARIVHSRELSIQCR